MLLHGDLTHLNLLVAERAEGWRITGLIDWGDVKLGPPTHEFISPGVHMYQGDEAPLAAWYRGYGWSSQGDAERDQHEIMARAMLYYAEDFARLNSNHARSRPVPGLARHGVGLLAAYPSLKGTNEERGDECGRGADPLQRSLSATHDHSAE